MNNYTVYEHINKINGKRYIGVTKQKPEKRWENGKGYIHNKHFYQAIEKYGWKEGFEHKIICSNLNEEAAYTMEQILIEQYDLTNPNKGYNINQGGFQRGPKHFEKMIKWANEHKKFGQELYNSKKVKCIETGDVFGSIQEAERWAGSTKIREVCEKRREHAGHHPLTKELLSWEYAKEDDIVTIEYHSNDRLEKNKNRIKKVKCLTTGIIYNSAAEAEKNTGICACNILRVCSGKRKTAGKMKWQYYEDNLLKGE